MPSSIQYSKVMMYADDTVIFYSSRQMLDIEQHLNLDLMNLSNWLSCNNLILNMKKTEYMVFGTRHRLGARDTVDLNINLDGKPVKYTKIYKYLGVVLGNTLSFNDHTLYMRKKVSKLLGMLSRIRPFR